MLHFHRYCDNSLNLQHGYSSRGNTFCEEFTILAYLAMKYIKYVNDLCTFIRKIQLRTVKEIVEHCLNLVSFVRNSQRIRKIEMDRCGEFE